jgi:hypothetical protein
MIQLIVRLGKWLETRFPEKVVVTLEKYGRLEYDIANCVEKSTQIDLILTRLSVVETNAVHKAAVQDLITAVKDLKNEYVSLKASLGMARIGDSDIKAMLNGEYIDPDGGI